CTTATLKHHGGERPGQRYQYNPPVPSPTFVAGPKVVWPWVFIVAVDTSSMPATPGSVPARKASSMEQGVPAGTSAPLKRSTGTKTIPGGTRNGIGGTPASASFMKSRKMGAATVAPCSCLPSVLGSS